MKRAKRISYGSHDVVEAVTLAQLGRSTKFISAETGLTACQITYRLTRAKRADGLPHGVGYRTAWRDGTSAIARRVDRLVGATLRRRNKSVLPKKVAKLLPSAKAA